MDYAVKVTIKNGRILRRMRECGFKTVAELSRASGIHQTHIGEIVNLKRAPIGRDGQWSIAVDRIAGVLRCDPEDLFTDAQMTMALKTNSSEVEMSEPSVISLMAGDMEESAWARIEADRLLGCLTPRERAITEAMMNGETYTNADPEGCSVTRVSQIHMKAIRKMKRAAQSMGMSGGYAGGVAT